MMTSRWPTTRSHALRRWVIVGMGLGLFVGVPHAAAAQQPVPPGDSSSPAAAMYVGRYTPGMERNTFRPCVATGRAPQWMVFLPDDLLAVRDSLVRAAGGGPPYLVRVMGRLSGEGRFGHLGQSSRILFVTEISGPASIPQDSCAAPKEATPPGPRPKARGRPDRGTPATLSGADDRGALGNLP